MRHLIIMAIGTGILASQSAVAQGTTAAAAKGWEITGIPAVNFNSDEGFGYGLIVQAFSYAPGALPYRLTIQPTWLRSTRGRNDISLFVDAPHVLPPGWRIGALLAREQQLATPYYGVGNASLHSDAAESPPNPYYYKYGRTGVRFTSDVQRTLGSKLRVLGGVGIRTTSIDETPFDSGTTLVAQQVGGRPPRGRTVYARAGVVLDTRDREIGPRHGIWAEALVQRAGMVLGATHAFTRVTATARGYVSPTDRVTIAERVTFQQLDGNVPFYELFAVQGSFKDDEGLGGAGTLRGWPKNRFAGKGIVMINNEVRYRALDFTLRRRPSNLILSGFVDAGRVWNERIQLSELGKSLHVGVGGGARLAFGPSFIVAVDVGHSKESAAGIYIGLGYLY